MQLLTTIYRHENVNLEGKTFLREAIRGVIFHAGKLLMIYSPVNGDYKFPGGGVDVGETHREALQRELLEEAGATLKSVTGELGKVIEYANALEPDFETFKMTSYYYFCEISKEMGAQNLDAYEADLGFQPVWVSIAEALETNQALFAQRNPVPHWTKRENFVLTMLLDVNF